MAKIKILMITHNRPVYTRLSLARLCETVPPGARITVWDNASSKETVEAVKSLERHPAIERIIYGKSNERLWAPTNWFWRNSGDADFLSKVDDDCLVPAAWCEVLSKAHNDIPQAGILGCWRFMPEDFDHGEAAKKIFSYGPHMILRNCWVEGSGYLMKRSVFDRTGPLRHKETFTTWCVRAAAKGFINGWYYPFLYQEHMDDPRAAHTGICTDEDFQRLSPLTAGEFGIKTKKDWTERLKRSAQRLQQYSLDPYDYIGLRAKIKNTLVSLIGKEYNPRHRK